MPEDLSTLTAEQRALLMLRLRKKSAAAAGAQQAQAPPLVPVARGGDLPLSFAQQRLWFLDQFEPGSTVYNIPLAVRLRGRLDVSALARALTEVVRRHEALRTTFALSGSEPTQIVHAPAPFPLPLEDLSGRPREERERVALEEAAQEARRPFDLARGPLVRAKLLRLGAEEHVALFTMHHIVSDGWSMGVLVREAGALYEAFVSGTTAQLPELPIQYADYAVWQRGWLRGEVLEAQLSYWRAQLEGAPPALELPTDRPRPAAPTSRGATEAAELDETLSERLRELSRAEGATLFMTLLAAFQLLLSHYSGRDDIVVGAPIANRNHVETEPLIGFFINMLVLRTDLSDDPTFRELLGRVRQTTVGAYAHQEVPFEKLVERLQPGRSSAQTPWVQVAVDFESMRAATLELPHLTLEPVGESGPASAKFDLVLNVRGTGPRLGFNMTYDTDVFEAATVRRMFEHLELLLRAAAARPEARLGELKAALREADARRRLAEQHELKERRRTMLKSARPKPVRAPLVKDEDAR